MSSRTRDEITRDQVMHAASRDARNARDEEDRKRSRAAAHAPKRMHTEKPGTVRGSDGVVINPAEES